MTRMTTPMEPKKMKRLNMRTANKMKMMIMKRMRRNLHLRMLKMDIDIVLNKMLKCMDLCISCWSFYEN